MKFTAVSLPILLLFVASVEAELEFTAKSLVPKELLESLELTCSLKNNDIKDDVKLHSIYILHEFAGVIAIVHRDSYRNSNPAIGALEVKGNISDENSSSSFLQLFSKQAFSKHSGQYYCLAQLLISDKIDVVSSKSLNIRVQQPSFDELITLVSELTSITERLATTEKEVARMKNELTWHARSFEILNENVSLIPHTEKGVHFCGSSNGWDPAPDWQSARQKTINILFSSPFSKPPVVSLEIRQLDADTAPGLRVFSDAKDITTTGFTLVCGTWSVSRINEMRINWHAI